jgi:tRNA(fMet)-specific endonuclease VapC
MPFDDAAAEQYGNVRSLLKREGRLIGANDLLIASIALATGSTLVTRNVDEFSRVPGLGARRMVDKLPGAGGRCDVTHPSSM